MQFTPFIQQTPSYAPLPCSFVNLIIFLFFSKQIPGSKMYVIQANRIMTMYV